MDFHEPIMITPRNAETLQENCLRCHGDFVHDIVGQHDAEDAVSASIAIAASATARGPELR